MCAVVTGVQTCALPISSWVVAVVFTPYMGVKLLPDIGKVEGGHDHIYGTPNYQRLRRFIGSIVARKKTVMLVVGGLFVIAILGLGVVQQQFFPVSDRPEVLVEVQMPEGRSEEHTSELQSLMRISYAVL